MALLNEHEDGTKVYGPYLRRYRKSSPRRQVVIRRPDGSKTSKSYARYLYEEAFGPIPSHMHVDHIDGDSLNDALENFQLVCQSDHNRKHNTGKPSPLAGVEKGFTHGTSYGWMKKKCRCDECAQAHRAFHDKRNASRRKK